MPDSKASSRDARGARLADALRANLRRRKAQARERADAEADEAADDSPAGVTHESRGGPEQSA